MLGAGVHCNRNRGNDRFFNSTKSRTNHLDHDHQHNDNQKFNQNDVDEAPKAVPLFAFDKFEPSLSNIERFLHTIIPSVNAHYLSKTTMRGWRTCEVEFQPYFMLSDLWDAYEEWSAYGAGVPLMMNGSDAVIQYYVPYLSGIQLYVDPSKSSVKSRRTNEDNDGDCYIKDSCSGGSSDSEYDRGLICSRGQCSHCIHLNDISKKTERLFLRDQHSAMLEGFLNNEVIENQRGCLFFEYFEYDPPFSREPISNKISYLASRFPKLKTLRSCDLLSSSWLSVAWYPIYRIPVGTTLKDLDACFLTYHSLYTPLGDAPAAQASFVIYPNEIDGIPRISLPSFGAAAFKFRGSMWTSNDGSDQLFNSLSVAADNWLRVRQVNHPDYAFFRRNR